MHLLDVGRGFYGGWGIVAGQLPVATGLALALVRQGRSQAVALRARRRRGQHGRLARVAQPGGALAPADRLPDRQQRVRHGHLGRARVGRARAVAARRRAPHARRARRRRRPRRRVRGEPAAAARRPRGAPAGRARGDDLPLPRPLGRRCGARLPHPGGDRGAPGRATRSCACASSCARPASTRPSSRRSTAAPTSACARPSSSPTRAPSPTSTGSPPRCTRPAAPSSSSACARAAPSARRSSSSTRGSGR